ncbi:Receptor-like protein kinase THESEUS 1 [Platanthera zijinensis]|uniref:Receptor-like protein kinase THESEUS 1 n=1 Tax=Platanthera zijinensis TaxID=2320716 RepID=A0AAP0FWU3_9ASPA
MKSCRTRRLSLSLRHFLFLGAAAAFLPPDDFLLNCGGNSSVKADDGRIFNPDNGGFSFPSSSPFFSPTSNNVASVSSSDLYTTARVFSEPTEYRFNISQQGKHFLRLHFFPPSVLPHDLRSATFSVAAGGFTLIRNFSFSNSHQNPQVVLKEYVIEIGFDLETLSLHIIPFRGSIAFINAIELISLPEPLFPSSASPVPQGPQVNISQNIAYEICYRINVGGPALSSKNDSLWRIWNTDSIRHSPGVSIYSAPDMVYATAREMADANVGNQMFNISWMFSVDSGFQYLVRLHFCDFLSTSPHSLLFNVYINNQSAMSSFDVSNKLKEMTTAYVVDFIVDVVMLVEKIFVQIGPTDMNNVQPNAFLNGIEIMKLSDAEGRLSAGSYVSSGPSNGFRRLLAFSEIKDGTENFDDSLLLGVGGFGKVYKGVLENGLTVAVKRANSQSQQGLVEFRTEIEMLSKLRHRHLVSLIGYCHEPNEMVLVYDFMAGGALRKHLYGSDLPPLSWKQRLEICIGAAKGLHYLHTGAAETIIHRDVKTSNILLDENLTAKVADFGLSKMGPTLDQTHVSTVVKGSFGYLDPEYFRSQRLTEKSDVYSFGVVMLEVLCARPAINPALSRDQINIVEWAMNWQRRGQLEKVIDPHLVGTISIESLRKFGETTKKCLAEHGIERPAMGDVLWNLEYSLQLQESFTKIAGDENSTNAIGGILEWVTNVTEVEHDNSSLISDEADPSTSRLFSQIIDPKGR